jgi:hypothetical protein
MRWDEPQIWLTIGCGIPGGLFLFYYVGRIRIALRSRRLHENDYRAAYEREYRAVRIALDPNQATLIKP